MFGEFVTVSEADEIIEQLYDNMFSALTRVDDEALRHINTLVVAWERLSERVIKGELVDIRPA